MVLGMSGKSRFCHSKELQLSATFTFDYKTRPTLLYCLENSCLSTSPNLPPFLSRLRGVILTFARILSTGFLPPKGSIVSFEDLLTREPELFIIILAIGNEMEDIDILFSHGRASFENANRTTHSIYIATCFDKSGSR